VITHWRLLIGVAALATAVAASAMQTPGPAAAGRGRGARGPSKPAPRHPNGRINLGPPPGEKGYWGGGGSIVATGGRGGGVSTNPTIDQIPFQPWAKALYQVRLKSGDKDDPHARCMPPGGPRQFQTPNGFEFIDQPEYTRILIVFGGGPHTWRLINMDGRPLPKHDDPDLPDTFFGYSSGRWEGDTLVVESTGYNEKFWMHRGGLPHTDALHLTERFSRPDYDTLRYDVTVDDPKAYTKPWSGGFTVPWTYTNWDGTPGGEIHEYFCQDNEKDYGNLR
jgi:hypothetical protein